MISTNANRSSHGLGTRKRILFFCKRRLARQMFLIVGNSSGREICITVISGRLPAGNVLIFLQTVAGAGYRKVRVM